MVDLGVFEGRMDAAKVSGWIGPMYDVTTNKKEGLEEHLRNCVVDSDLATKVSSSPDAVFVDKLPKIAEYNKALEAKLNFTPKETRFIIGHVRARCGSGMINALRPFEGKRSSKEILGNARPDEDIYETYGRFVQGLDAVLTEELGSTPHQELASKISKLALYGKQAVLAAPEPDYARIGGVKERCADDLEATSRNAGTLVKLYEQIRTFRDEFRGQFSSQIKAFVHLHTNPNDLYTKQEKMWEYINAFRMEQFFR